LSGTFPSFQVGSARLPISSAGAGAEPIASAISGRTSRGVSQTAARSPIIGAAALPSDFPTTTVSSASVASSAARAWPRIHSNGSSSPGARSSTSTADHPRA